MAESIEAFVRKLQEEGVEAGKAQAQRLLEQAKAQAEQTVSDASAQAEQILAEAKDKAQQVLQQGQDELELAARDALLRLREAVVAAARELLRRAADDALARPDVLLGLLRDVVAEYARADAQGRWPAEIRVSDQALDAVTAWAVRELAAQGKDPKTATRLLGCLKSAGFEYTTNGGEVEVTPDSVAEVLGNMVSPRLREMLVRAVETPPK